MSKNNSPIKKDDKKKRLISIITAFTIFSIFLGLYYASDIMLMFQEKVPYNQFVEYVDEGTVSIVDIDKSSGKMKFELKDDEKVYYTNYPFSENFEEELLKKDVEIKIEETNWLTTIFEYGFTPLIMIAFILIFAKTLNIDVDTATTNAKDIKQKTTFDDVAGLTEIKEDMKFLAEMITNEKYINSGVRIPKGVLLEGPPGNGKTLLAKAFANEAGVNFIAVNASDFGSKFVGVGSQKIKSVFDNARKTAPAVIFIDEFDAVGAKRSSGSDASDKEMNTMITALLNQMDGFKPMDKILVLAATNRAEELDEALIRPGRFDKKYTIGPPDRDARLDLLKLYTKDIKLENADLKILAKKTYGYSCSAIESIVNEARILALRDNSEMVTEKHFEDAILQMTIRGHIKKNAKRTNEEKEITAYHEAGHAVAAYFQSNRKVSSINAMPTTSGMGGFTSFECDDNSLSPLSEDRNELIVLYAGQMAEAVLRGDKNKVTAGASADIHEATKLASHYVALMNGIDYSLFRDHGVKELMDEVKVLLNNAKEESYVLIQSKWKHVDAVAKELLEKEYLSEKEFEEIMKNIE